MWPPRRNRRSRRPRTTRSEHGIGYTHLEALGGRRSSPLAAFPNGAWENDSFRAYADYALTDPFQDALEELIGLADGHTPAIRCAETVSVTGESSPTGWWPGATRS